MINLKLVASASIALALAAGQAMAIDASCVAVQVLGVEDDYRARSPEEQQRFASIMEQVRQLEAHTLHQVSAGEAAFNREFDNLRARMPGATDVEIADALFAGLSDTPALDQAHAQAMSAEFDVHHDEAMVMAYWSQLARDGHQERIAAAAQAYAQRAPDISAVIEGNESLRQLAGIAALSEEIDDLGADYTTQRAASDAAQIGLDRENPNANDLDMSIQTLARLTAAAHARGAQARLVLVHQHANLGGAEVRREITAPNATQTGVQGAGDAALALQAYSGAANALRATQAVVRTVPPPPPPEAMNTQQGQTWRAQATEVVQQAVQTVRRRIGSADLVQAVGAPAQ